MKLVPRVEVTTVHAGLFELSHIMQVMKKNSRIQREIRGMLGALEFLRYLR